ncbi:terminase small subunit [Kiritimatiellota bacterium B12222]|nr:terminase small subunit [Kiritimatiellota bacterium B12222]
MKDNDRWFNGLTEKQRRFCEAYSANGGNALEATRSAGYAKAQAQSSRLLTNTNIREALEKLRLETTCAAIATREGRQRFWTRTMFSKDEEMKERLRASELLGKSQGDFIDRKEISGPGGEPINIVVKPPKVF